MSFWHPVASKNDYINLSIFCPFISKINNLSNNKEIKGSQTLVGYYFWGFKPVAKLWFCLELALFSVSHWFLLFSNIPIAQGFVEKFISITFGVVIIAVFEILTIMGK